MEKAWYWDEADECLDKSPSGKRGKANIRLRAYKQLGHAQVHQANGLYNNEYS